MTAGLAVAPVATDRDRALATLTMAFAGDPLLRWLYPDPSSYLDTFPTLIDRYAGQAFELGSAYWSQDFTGAALWLPPGVAPEEATVVELLRATVDPDRHADVFSLLEHMDANHPTDPVWYLPVIGVQPGHQGRGIGSMLLARGLAVVDADGLPAYLESSSPRNTPLYERHGFSVVGEIQVADGPPIWPMLRPAQR